MNRLDPAKIIGQQFGSLTVEAATDLRSAGNIVWLCRCSCGGTRSDILPRLRGGKAVACARCVAERMRLAAGAAADRRVEGRFWSYVDRSGDGCWHWTGGIDRDGYGNFWVSSLGRSVKAQGLRPTMWRTE